MATHNSSGIDGASGNEVAIALVNVVQRMIEEAARLQVQEALRLQEQEAERRVQEAVRLQVQEAMRLQEQEAERRDQEAVRLQVQEAVRLQVQEAVRLQEQEAERRVQEAVRLQVQEAVRLQELETVRLQEERAATALRQMEQQLRERDNAISALRHSLDERVQRLEARVAAVEEHVSSASARRETEGTGEQGALGQLESRMGKLEEAVQRALASVFPRVEALVERLESSPPGARATTPSASTSSTCSSPSSFAPTASASAASAFGPEEGEAAGYRHVLELRMRDATARRDRARARPSRLGEELCKAAFEGEATRVRRLLSGTLDRSVLNYTCSHGGTPLISAFFLGERRGRVNLEVVRLLLERGADVRAIDVDGWTALHCAAAYDPSGRTAALLLEAGADVNARDEHGATPLHRAAYEDHEEVVRTLLAHGADKSLRCWSEDWEGNTPYDLAQADSTRDSLRIESFEAGGYWFS